MQPRLLPPPIAYQVLLSLPLFNRRLLEKGMACTQPSPPSASSPCSSPHAILAAAASRVRQAPREAQGHDVHPVLEPGAGAQGGHGECRLCGHSVEALTFGWHALLLFYKVFRV